MRRDDEDIFQTTLPNGVRLLLLRQPQLHTAAACVFVGAGSAHEARGDNGIGHFAEHMVFKGTARRDARRINLDAERLGAEVNAHTDKDHTAFHMRGLAAHATDFIHMLADLVCAPSFPPDELERERQVLLQEHAEDADDPVSTAFKLFDRACFGDHPAAQPVIGPRRHVERFGRDDLQAWVRQRYTGTNVVLALAGPLDADAVLRAAEPAFAALPAGTRHAVEPPAHEGGIVSRRTDGSSQTHLVLGWGLPALAGEDVAATVAAAVLGEGMSSPLLHAVREREALAYHASCSAEVLGVCGQLVIEASTAPEQSGRLLDTVGLLLRRHAQSIDAVDLERAHNQLAVRQWRARERPLRRLEDLALDLLYLGRLRPTAERLQALREVGAAQVRAVFERLLAQPAAVAVTGDVPRATRDRVRRALAA